MKNINENIVIVDFEQSIYSEPDVTIDKIVDNKRYQYCRFSAEENLYKEISNIARRWRDGEISQAIATELLEFISLPYERWLFDTIVDLAQVTQNLEYIADDDEHNDVKAIAFLQHGDDRSFNIQYK
ncbi:MAG: hypothetical protein K8F52_10375 [Candidatus Scalindua rubra]|uniref:Uncharacterized protein n=1 Tax=Candidatus Scalindua brodae TaxID=237368 RepID=A0A0B0EGP0_9BACT|nr:MAG: hypothetical protein SCABRO_02015 [Candidatus Scalindua brodae]MBZ0109064.1 hypothetical protein [Candidatus Scalindua rubra]